MNGYGYGDGSGYSSGGGYGYGSGSGYGDGDGDGDGYGYGSGYGEKAYLLDAAFSPRQALDFPNAELRRGLIEHMGPDRFFKGLDAQVVHADVDGCGNPRRLLRVPCEDAAAGYLQAVEVVCPTTRRVYHLGVQPDVVTCQEAVASTFGLRAEEYQPVRET